MVEQSVVEAIKKFVQAQGGKVIKFQGTVSQEAGTPDLIGGLWGIPFMCEVKQPGDPHPLSPLQRVRINEWKAQGYVAIVAHSVLEFVSLMRIERYENED